MFEPAMTNPAEILAKAGPAKVGRVTRKLFQGVAADWALSEAERAGVLGLPNVQAYRHWLETDGPVAAEALERVSLLVGIYRALLAQVPSGQTGRWLRQSLAVFDGRSASQVILSDGLAGLYRVREYLDAVGQN